MASTWANIDDFYSRFGEELVNKLGIRRNWDSTLQQYVASEDESEVEAVINIAIADAKALVQQRLRCKFGNLVSLDTNLFTPIKQWHMKMTIEVLKVGGDCMNCDCTKIDDWISKCDNVCADDDTVCLSSNSCFISATEYHSPCECHGACGCCK